MEDSGLCAVTHLAQLGVKIIGNGILGGTCHKEGPACGRMPCDCVDAGERSSHKMRRPHIALVIRRDPLAGGYLVTMSMPANEVRIKCVDFFTDKDFQFEGLFFLPQ